MVRAPCCEKMGLKKGPWTQEEDQLLVGYINKHGHGNWRALPKQAGLLRCGKSCRLRWTNYLRPDIKRGNFSREEEDTIIKLHDMLGNRWSAIAARLPGRTDNEIKNVWHTHLKKRLSSNPRVQEAPTKVRPENKIEIGSDPNSAGEFRSHPTITHANSTWSFENNSDLSSSGATSLSYLNGEYMDFSSQEFQEIIGESFWNEALSMENGAMPANEDALEGQGSREELSSNTSSIDEDTNFWLKIFKEAEYLFGLPEL